MRASIAHWSTSNSLSNIVVVSFEVRAIFGIVRAQTRSADDVTAEVAGFPVNHQ